MVGIDYKYILINGAFYNLAASSKGDNSEICIEIV